MKHPSASAAPPSRDFSHRLLSILLGLFLALCLLKFGNPPIMEKYVTPPGNIYELLLGFPWPITWAYLGLAGLLVVGWRTARWELPVIGSVDAPAAVLVRPDGYIGHIAVHDLAGTTRAAVQAMTPLSSASTPSKRS